MFEKTLENKNACLYNKTMNIEIKNSNYTTQEKLQILADAAKYDVACTSQFCGGRKMYFPVKNPDDKSLCL